MKTFYPLLCTAALLGPGALLSRATDPAAPATGKVLVVDDRHTMEGDIEHVADQYRIRHGGGETWLPANKALRLCASYEEALAYLRTQANLDDPDEHLRLALWCRDRKLSAEALAEVRRAVELAAKNAELRDKGAEVPPSEKAMRALLNRLESEQRTAATPKPGASMGPEAPLAPLPVNLTAESMGQFISHIQPILMNSCASCHANNRPTSTFRLMHAADLGSLKATQQNLAAVLGQVNLNQPQASPFLVNALGVHGGMVQAPFKNREAVAFQTLETWVASTVAANPRLRDVLPPAPAPTLLPSSPLAFGEDRMPQTGGVAEGSTVPGSRKRGTGQVIDLPADEANALNAIGGGASGLPGPAQPNGSTTAPQDVYDPGPFNRDNHPQPLPPLPQPQTPPMTPARTGVR